jgi:hypothetical protein
MLAKLLLFRQISVEFFNFAQKTVFFQVYGVLTHADVCINGAVVPPYPSTNEGFKRLIKDYGTHLLRRADLGGKMKYSTTIDLSKVENEYYNGDWWLMQLRMVQPLNVKTK